MEEAQDVVQDTFLKWLTIDHQKIENTGAYLVKSVTNNAISRLKALKRIKEQGLESIKEIEIADKHDFFNFDIETELTAALSLLHKKLEPIEKAVFVLREVFNYEYDELQVLLNKKKDNCRQIFCRAKSKISQEKSKLHIEFSTQHGLLDAFKKACTKGNVVELLENLLGDSKNEISLGNG